MLLETVGNHQDIGNKVIDEIKENFADMIDRLLKQIEIQDPTNSINYSRLMQVTALNRICSSSLKNLVAQSHSFGNGCHQKIYELIKI